MKLFEENIEEALDYLRHAVINDEMELELVFGATVGQSKEVITKEVFMRVLDKCRKEITYEELPEIIDLDIKCQLPPNPHWGNQWKPKPHMNGPGDGKHRKGENQFMTDLRATIHGLDAIKKYCKDGDLRKLDDENNVGPLPESGRESSVEFILKQSVGRHKVDSRQRWKDRLLKEAEKEENEEKAHIAKRAQDRDERERWGKQGDKRFTEDKIKMLQDLDDEEDKERPGYNPPAWLVAERYARKQGVKKGGGKDGLTKAAFDAQLPTPPPLKADMEKRAIIDDDYNVRLKLNTEHILFNHVGADGIAEGVGTRGVVRSFLHDYKDKLKHYRYKKRFSFLTEDKLFRIDLTIVKSTKSWYVPQGKGKKRVINFQPSFKKANILKEKEEYEIEIEYVGASTRIPSSQEWRTQKEPTHKMISPINELYANYLAGKKDYYPQMKGKGNIYDPLALGINTDIFEEQYLGDSTDEGYPENVFDSPRYDGDENPTLFMKLSEDTPTKKYSYDEYRDLQGKSTMIKREYFVEHGIDMKVFNTLMEYSKRNIFYAKISDITEEIDEKTNEFIEVRAEISLYPPIGSVRFLHVPLEYLVGGGAHPITEGRLRDPGSQAPAAGGGISTDELDAKERALALEEGAWKENLLNKWQAKGVREAENPQENLLDIDPNLEILLKNIFKTLEKTVKQLTVWVYNTESFISRKKKVKAIEEYSKLTAGYEKAKFKLVGPQPVSIDKGGLDINNPGTILVDYAVTEKADGERYQLFIIKGEGYFINQKGEVIDSGCSFGNIKGKWLFDGEYITKDKDNKPIRLFMIFDVYWCDIEGVGIPLEAYKLPFITRDPLMDKGGRAYIMKWFMENHKPTSKQIIWGEDRPPGETLAQRQAVPAPEGALSADFPPATEIRLKTYEFGYQSKSKEETRDAKEIGKYGKIFDAATKILRKNEEGAYEYSIDGLIYLPTRLSIKGKEENVNVKKIYGTWDYNYKWKPPEENTIDFKVNVKTELNKGQIKEIISTYSNDEDGTRKKEEYKSVDLLVGYDDNQDPNTKFCMEILKNIDITQKGKSDLQKFNIHSDEDEKYNETNIKLVNGKMLCEKCGSEITDGDFVEMRFNPKAENGMFWEPLKLRSDKTKPQFFTIANKIWKTINDPVTEEMITGSARDGCIIGGDEIIRAGEYYISGTEDMITELEPLRKFHNKIKEMLIVGVCSSFKGSIKVMDLSIGRGGDLSKYLETKNVSFLFGIDISSNVNEACRRFYNDKKKGGCKTVIVRGDTSKNIQNLEFSDVKESTKEDKKHCEIMTNIVYGNNSPIPEEYKGIREDKNYFKAVGEGFDIISSQFSMHYYFESNSTFSGFIRNLKENTKKGGYFIGTCYDGQKIFDYFEWQVAQEAKAKAARDFTPAAAGAHDSDDWTESDSDESPDLPEDPSSSDVSLSYTDIVGNLVYQIDKKYDLENFDYDESDKEKMFGNVIDVYMDSIGQTLPEYLVNFEFFVKIMKENGFEPFVPNVGDVPKDLNYVKKLFEKSNFDNQNIGEFKKVIGNIEKDKEKPFYNRQWKAKAHGIGEGMAQGAVRRSDGTTRITPLDRLSSFNNYFIFKKMK